MKKMKEQEDEYKKQAAHDVVGQNSIEKTHSRKAQLAVEDTVAVWHKTLDASQPRGPRDEA